MDLSKFLFSLILFAILGGSVAMMVYGRKARRAFLSDGDNAANNIGAGVADRVDQVGYLAFFVTLVVTILFFLRA